MMPGLFVKDKLALSRKPISHENYKIKYPEHLKKNFRNERFCDLKIFSILTIIK